MKLIFKKGFKNQKLKKLERKKLDNRLKKLEIERMEKELLK